MKLGYKSTTEALRDLTASIEGLGPIRSHVAMGNLHFESLCHAIAGALQEISLRMVKEDVVTSSTCIEARKGSSEVREAALEAREALREASTNLVASAKHPFKAFPVLDEEVVLACRRALNVVECKTVIEMRQTSGQVLESLDVLEKSASYKDLFRNMKSFGSKLHTFLSLASALSHDLCSSRGKGRIGSRAETLRKLLPILVQALRESLRHPANSHIRTNKEYFFGVVRGCVEGIVRVFEEASIAEDNPEETLGVFIQNLDAALDLSDDPDINVDEDLPRLNKHVEWVVKFCLAVSKFTRARDEEAEMVSMCHDAVRAGAALKASVEGKRSPSKRDAAREALRDTLELLEQGVNNVLLKLVLEIFCSNASPLDELIQAILSSPVSPPDRLPEDLDSYVSALDDWADLLFHLAHFITRCTNDASKTATIEAAMDMLQELEQVLVPACLKLYFNPEDHGARSHLRSTRTLWISEVATLETGIMGVVDATAFCVVAAEEARRLTGLLKKDQYSQDRLWLHTQGSKLVKTCQRAVDFAWKEVADQEEALPDDHPIVKVERSTWEVLGALRLVLNSIEDLNLHKTFLRRAQVLVTCLSIMSQFLVNRVEERDRSQGSSRVRVLTSISRITIGQDLVVSQHKAKDNQKSSEGTNVVNRSLSRRQGSNAAGLSFRSSAHQKRRSSRAGRNGSPSATGYAGTVDPHEVNDSIARLAEQAATSDVFQASFNTRKQKRLNLTQSSQRASGATTGFDFTEIFEQLSALSADISRRMKEDANAPAKEATGIVHLSPKKGENPKPVPKMGRRDLSLRQVAMRNNQNMNVDGYNPQGIDHRRQIEMVREELRQAEEEILAKEKSEQAQEEHDKENTA